MIDFNNERIMEKVKEIPFYGDYDVVVAGGGVALINASSVLLPMLENAEGDEKTGIKIVLKALEEPVRQIALNSGLEGSVIIDKIRTAGTSNYGFDVRLQDRSRLLLAVRHEWWHHHRHR